MDINTKAIGEVVLALLYPWNQNRTCKRSELIVKQNEITQLNKDDVWLVAEAGTATKRLREQQAYGEQLQIALNRALADHPRVEAERDTLQGTFSSQTEQHAQARTTLESLTTDRAKLAAQVDAYRLLLSDYRACLGLHDATG